MTPRTKPEADTPGTPEGAPGSGPDPSASPQPSRVPDDPLFQYDYDGIREFDNPLPGWWVLLFWATIVYSALYVANFIPGIGEGKGRLTSYERDLRQAEAKYGALRAPATAVSAEALTALSHDRARLAGAKLVFETNCAACHKPDGGGLIGPNLTDEFWIHGGRPTDLYRTVSEGVLDKGMPAWGRVMKPGDLEGVVAYVISLQGTQPADPKAPQGQRWAETDETERPHDHAEHR